MAYRMYPVGQYSVVSRNRNPDFQGGPSRHPLDLAFSKAWELQNMLNLGSCLQSSVQSSYWYFPLHYRHCCCRTSQGEVVCGSPDSIEAEMVA
jgi:hypothetical protein